MNPFAVLRRPAAAPEPPVYGPLSVPKRPTGPVSPPRSIPVTLPPSRACEDSEPSAPAWIWQTAGFGDVERIREAVVLDELADLTIDLGSPLAAAQYLYAPDLSHRPGE